MSQLDEQIDKRTETWDQQQTNTVKSRLSSLYHQGNSYIKSHYTKLSHNIISNDDDARDNARTIVELIYWKHHLTADSSDAEASKALGEMDDVSDALGKAIYLYNTDGIDDSSLAEDNINDFLEEDHDDIEDARTNDDKDALEDAEISLSDDRKTKKFIDSHQDYYYYGGTPDPVESDTVLEFISQQLGPKLA